MKPVTATAIVALILAIPIILKTQKFFARAGESDSGVAWENPDTMYDIDDFLT